LNSFSSKVSGRSSNNFEKKSFLFFASDFIGEDFGQKKIKTLEEKNQ
jgi:hypothetical protein